MDIGSLGVDIGIIIAIGSISEAIKSADPENKLKRFYLLVPVIFSVSAAVAVAMIDKDYSSIFLNAIKYFGITNFGYAFIKKTLLKK